MLGNEDLNEMTSSAQNVQQITNEIKNEYQGSTSNENVDCSHLYVNQSKQSKYMWQYIHAH